ncbi:MULTISPECIES: lysozyme [Chelatococcus]|uniref:Lysozyme n=1 Tax=Chelatococcus caeni TaxID=1348468 RepID=A0A840BX02_9HYPH|nr:MULTISPECIES: glycoside hydrolase family protein [Chelatococcus]ALA19359.1 lysozyme [Chelatococcus sp. CO-6]MBB4017574.1 lysozyme [Chelatococcus caeni]
MARRVNAEGLRLIKQWEGLRLRAYRDSGGIWTIGYGHTSDEKLTVREGLTITEAMAEEMLVHDLREAEAAVERLVKVPLTDNQFAVLVSFVFNIGVGAFEKSTLLRKLNAGQHDAVPGELARWVHVKGQRVQGLVNRRAAEAGLWAKGSFVCSNTVEPQPDKPPVVDKETVSWGAGILSTLGALFAGSGPVQWALAVVIVASFGVGLWFFIRKRVRAA